MRKWEVIVSRALRQESKDRSKDVAEKRFLLQDEARVQDVEHATTVTTHPNPSHESRSHEHPDDSKVDP